MKPLFKNITIYNSKNYNQFIEFHGSKFNFSYNLYTFVMLGLLFYCVILNIIQKDFYLFLLFLTLFVLMFLFRIYFPAKKYEKTKEIFSKAEQISITIEFYKFYFKIENKIYPYLKLFRVFETNDYFYLYIDDEHAVLVNKNGFKIGSLEDFIKFIKKKCLFKYRA